MGWFNKPPEDPHIWLYFEETDKIPRARVTLRRHAEIPLQFITTELEAKREFNSFLKRQPFLKFETIEDIPTDPMAIKTYNIDIFGYEVLPKRTHKEWVQQSDVDAVIEEHEKDGRWKFVRKTD